MAECLEEPPGVAGWTWSVPLQIARADADAMLELERPFANTNSNSNLTDNFVGAPLLALVQLVHWPHAVLRVERKLVQWQQAWSGGRLHAIDARCATRDCLPLLSIANDAEEPGPWDHIAIYPARADGELVMEAQPPDTQNRTIVAALQLVHFRPEALRATNISISEPSAYIPRYSMRNAIELRQSACVRNSSLSDATCGFFSRFSRFEGVNRGVVNAMLVHQVVQFDDAFAQVTKMRNGHEEGRVGGRACSDLDVPEVDGAPADARFNNTLFMPETLATPTTRTFNGNVAALQVNSFNFALTFSPSQAKPTRPCSVIRRSFGDIAVEYNYMMIRILDFDFAAATPSPPTPPLRLPGVESEPSDPNTESDETAAPDNSDEMVNTNNKIENKNDEMSASATEPVAGETDLFLIVAPILVVCVLLVCIAVFLFAKRKRRTTETDEIEEKFDTPMKTRSTASRIQAGPQSDQYGSFSRGNEKTKNESDVYVFGDVERAGSDVYVIGDVEQQVKD